MKFNRLPKDHGLQLVNQFSVRKTSFVNKFYLNQLKEFIEPLVGMPRNDIVPVYNFSFNPEIDSNNLYEYSYRMQRLYPLTSKEEEIVDSSVVNLGTEWEDKCGIMVFAKKNNPTLYNFLSRVLLNLKYKDMHGGNVMKNKEGVYLTIDLEGFIF